MITVFRVKKSPWAAWILPVWLCLAQVPSLGAEPPTPDATAEARRLFEAGMRDESLQTRHWPRILRIAPDSAYSLFIIAEGQDSFKKQIALYTRAITLEPRFFDAYVERARAKGELEDLSGALADIEAALKIRPRDFGAVIDRGNYKQRGNNFADGIADFTFALSLAADAEERALALLYRGETYLVSGETAAALHDAHAGLKLLPKGGELKDRMSVGPELLYLRGRARLKAGQRDAGCDDLKRAIRLGQTFAEMERDRFCRPS